MASKILKTAFTTDIGPILATARARKGGAIDPIGTYRAMDYRNSIADQRPAKGGSGSGIV